MASDVAYAPLTHLSEDEQLLRQSVRDFAQAEIRPIVREMDEHAKMSPDLIKKLFGLGTRGTRTRTRQPGRESDSPGRECASP